MFIDYYEILGVDETSSNEAIKLAFKKMALKWHPDRNPGMDTTQKMQELNEAYLILKDVDARRRYDIEYQKFKQYKQSKKQHTGSTQSNSESSSDKNTYEYSNYDINDEVLKKWMSNAKRQAVDLAKQTIEDLTGMIAIGTKTAIKETGSYLFFYLIASLLLSAVFILVKSCNN